MTREEKQALVGEYVLGLLDAKQLETFEAARQADPELDEMTQLLADRMSALDNIGPAAPYAPDLWQRIDAQLTTTAQNPGAAVVPFAVAQKAAPPRQWLALAASVVVALGIGYLAGSATNMAPAPAVIAVLLNETDASPAVIIEAFADDSIHLVPLDNFSAPQGQVLEVWTLPNVATGPISLGTLPTTRDTKLAGPSLPTPQPGQLYEITLEPAPGSPTGRPTGPILVKGFAKQPLN